MNNVDWGSMATVLLQAVVPGVACRWQRRCASSLPNAETQLLMQAGPGLKGQTRSLPKRQAGVYLSSAAEPEEDGQPREVATAPHVGPCSCPSMCSTALSGSVAPSTAQEEGSNPIFVGSCSRVCGASWLVQEGPGAVGCGVLQGQQRSPGSLPARSPRQAVTAGHAGRPVPTTLRAGGTRGARPGLTSVRGGATGEHPPDLAYT